MVVAVPLVAFSKSRIEEREIKMKSQWKKTKNETKQNKEGVKLILSRQLKSPNRVWQCSEVSSFVCTNMVSIGGKCFSMESIRPTLFSFFCLLSFHSSSPPYCNRITADEYFIRLVFNRTLFFLFKKSSSHLFLSNKKL